MKKITLLLILLSVNAFAQFDSLIFIKYIATNDYVSKNIIAMGDQNDDGYDDFIAYNCSTKSFTLFYGGNPPDTTLNMHFNYEARGRGLAAIDINLDGKKDIILKNQEYLFLVFWGGQNIDTIPDMQFNTPKGASYNFGSYIKNAGDFNGDGFDDLIMYDPYLPNSNEEIGVDYFCSVYPAFDLIPEMVFHGDTLNNIRKGITSFGDLNGDSLQDFLYVGRNVPDSNRYIGIVLGNQQWDTTTIASYYESEHPFIVYSYRVNFINDINKDGKDDLLIQSYGNFYPYYFNQSILYGSIPLDTIPDVGLNTQNVNILNEVSIGDVNGDGFNDFLSLQGFGYPIAKLWLGSNNMNNNNLPIRAWGNSPDFFGGMINKVGDVDGDGVNDFALGTATMTGTCRDGLFVIVKGDTSVKVVGVKNDTDAQPEGFKLLEPYPNPFNPEVKIEFKTGERAIINLTLFDILGREIKRIIIDEEKDAGSYEVEINSSTLNLSSGVYIIKMEAIKESRTVYSSSKKINLIK